MIHEEEERICVNSDSSETDPANLTVRVVYTHGGYGAFCTDTPFSSSSACIANVSLPDIEETTVMLFKASNHIGEKGDFALNFTRDGVLLASAVFYYGECTMHPSLCELSFLLRSVDVCFNRFH